MDSRRLSFSGWLHQSFTTGTATTNNLPIGGNVPIVWNDRNNRYAMQQLWGRLERSVDTEASHMTIGGRADILFGTDYRYTLMRGLFNGQLGAAAPNQMWYGFDLPQFYGNVYLPNFLNGVDLKIGRMFCPWGVESIEAVSSPFLTKSYAFNWAPPFTHFGVMATVNVSDQLQAVAMLVNGNDVWVDQTTQQQRFVGKLQYTGREKKQTISVAATLGRAVFDTSSPFAPITFGLQTEPFGRNNLNAVDVVYTRKMRERFSTAVELIYGWQYANPALAVPGFTAGGFASWFASALYGFLDITEHWKAQVRGEIFLDAQGQRTGFLGTYYAGTAGLVFTPRKALQIRPEIRWDYNGQSTPFDNGTRNNLFVGAIDAIIRY
jgi:hypothetical protein